jgi:hypothetical protein
MNLSWIVLKFDDLGFYFSQSIFSGHIHSEHSRYVQFHRVWLKEEWSEIDLAMKHSKIDLNSHLISTNSCVYAWIFAALFPTIQIRFHHIYCMLHEEHLLIQLLCGLKAAHATRTLVIGPNQMTNLTKNQTIETQQDRSRQVSLKKPHDLRVIVEGQHSAWTHGETLGRRQNESKSIWDFMAKQLRLLEKDD